MPHKRKSSTARSDWNSLLASSPFSSAKYPQKSLQVQCYNYGPRIGEPGGRRFTSKCASSGTLPYKASLAPGRYSEISGGKGKLKCHPRAWNHVVGPHRIRKAYHCTTYKSMRLHNDGNSRNQVCNTISLRCECTATRSRNPRIIQDTALAVASTRKPHSRPAHTCSSLHARKPPRIVRTHSDKCQHSGKRCGQYASEDTALF